MTTSKRQIEITITADIIARADSADCYFCAVALALNEATGLPWHVWKDSARIEVLWGRKPIFVFPTEVRRFVAAFDRGDAVEPICFKLPARFADKKRWEAMGAWE